MKIFKIPYIYFIIPLLLMLFTSCKQVIQLPEGAPELVTERCFTKIVNDMDIKLGFFEVDWADHILSGDVGSDIERIPTYMAIWNDHKILNLLYSLGVELNPIEYGLIVTAGVAHEWCHQVSWLSRRRLTDSEVREIPKGEIIFTQRKSVMGIIMDYFNRWVMPALNALIPQAKADMTETHFMPGPGNYFRKIEVARQFQELLGELAATEKDAVQDAAIIMISEYVFKMEEELRADIKEHGKLLADMETRVVRLEKTAKRFLPGLPKGSVGKIKGHQNEPMNPPESPEEEGPRYPHDCTP